MFAWVEQLLQGWRARREKERVFQDQQTSKLVGECDSFRGLEVDSKSTMQS